MNFDDQVFTLESFLDPIPGLEPVNGQEILSVDSFNDLFSIGMAVNEQSGGFNCAPPSPPFGFDLGYVYTDVFLGVGEAKMQNNSIGTKKAKRPSSPISPEQKYDFPQPLTASQKKRLREQARNLTCFNCGTRSTPLWRRTSDKMNMLCNACAMYEKQNNATRPKSMAGKRSRSKWKTTLYDGGSMSHYGVVDGMQGESILFANLTQQRVTGQSTSAETQVSWY